MLEKCPTNSAKSDDFPPKDLTAKIWVALEFLQYPILRGKVISLQEDNNYL